MTKKLAEPKTGVATIASYASLLGKIKQRIRTAQLRTAMAGNASMLMLYWEVGGLLVKR